jgi:hypothetical protein
MSGGRPRVCPDDVLLLVVTMRRNGSSMRAVATTLTGMGVPTPCGKTRWHASYVCRLLQTRDGQRLFAAADPVAELRTLSPPDNLPGRLSDYRVTATVMPERVGIGSSKAVRA